ncbi:TonB-dependent receptor domain-containing protein [Novosphingobium terrae]|uniref:TonB-dependent receptor domain-containing protein n=1 Tax=Novosphingobium terrae TaxID=2726189 RepID=UPI001981828D|nr:TonB-dependent receptor [Novosphingobium terrae]
MNIVLKLSAAPIALSIALISSSASAQGVPANASDAKDAENAIVVVGSSIKQAIDKSPLPVTVLSSADIAKTGQMSATDVIQNLPAMQGFVPASSSVNGGGGGVSTAAIHALPSKYTLTLLDGQRVAPQALGSVQGGGYGVNIESIPLEAVESIEVLRDGAGALYGADAVAGVVNFRLKKDYNKFDAYITGSAPQRKGGSSWSAGFSKGFGKLSEDGYNVFVSYSHDVQGSLGASQRSFSRNGAVFPFTANGKSYFMNNATGNTEPANISFSSNGKSYAYSPYLMANGNCGNALAAPQTTDGSTTCRFNYAGTVQDIPYSKRDSGMFKATVKAGESGEVWVSGIFSQYDMTAQYAASAQPMGINATTRFPSLWNKYVVPYMAANGIDPSTVTSATLGYRSISAGGRADDYGSMMSHISAGYDGSFKGFDIHLALTESHVHATDSAAGGYTDYNQLAAAVASGAYDPVTGQGASALQSSLLNGYRFSTTDSDVKSAKLNIQHKLFALPGGDAIMSLGGEYDHTSYKVSYGDLILSQSGFATQPASSDYPVGGSYGQVPFSAKRGNWGIFTEMKFPVTSKLEINAQGRYDSYSRVHSDNVYSSTQTDSNGLFVQLPSANLGNTFNSATGKLALRYTPNRYIAFRSSIGTGFRAPALSDIAGAVVFNGTTSGTYGCPFPGSAGCQPGSAQYDLLLGPNGQSGANGLKPEKSVNWGLGVAITPRSGLYFNLDYWNVKITHQIQSQGIAEQDGFTNPGKYGSLFVNPYQDPAGYQTIAFQQLPFNGGEAKYSGIDWDVGYSTRTPIGKLSANWSGTWMLTQKYSYSDGGTYNTDLGTYGPDQQVVFRVVSQASIGLETGKFSNSFTGHFKSGYHDQAYTAAQGVIFTNVNGQPGTAVDFGGLSIPAYVTVDWQGSYQVNAMLKVTVGIKNLTDKDPPLSLQTGGGGNQVGYDGRYYDPIGRSFYGRVNVKF